MKSIVLACLVLCAGVAHAQNRLNSDFRSGSATSGNNNFGSSDDRFNSGSGSSSNRFGSGSTSDRDFGSSGSSSNRLGSSGSGSDRFGSSGSNSDRFGSSGSSSDRLGSTNNRDSDRFGSSGTRDSDRFSVGSGNSNRFTDNSDGDSWDSDSDLDSQRIMAWPGGIIPYEISSDISSANSKILKDTLDFVSRRTCVQFVPRGRNDANYTVFQSGSSCSAPIGMSLKRDSSMGSSRGSLGSSMSSRGGSSSSRDSMSRDSSNGYRSTVTLADGCFKAKRLARRIMNLLGLPHEMSRPDRDQYVTINPSNIRSGYANNIKILSSSSWLPGVLDIPYDLNSVTQYNDSDLAKDKRTWAVKAKSSRVSSKDLGGEDFSEGDMQKINAAYNCRSGSRSGSGSSSSGNRPRNF